MHEQRPRLNVHSTLFLIPLCALHRSNGSCLVTHHMLRCFPSHFISFSGHAVRLAGRTHPQRMEIWGGRGGVWGGWMERRAWEQFSGVIMETVGLCVRVSVSTFIFHHPPCHAASLSLSLCLHCRGNTGSIWDPLLSLCKTHANRLGCKTPVELTHTA